MYDDSSFQWCCYSDTDLGDSERKGWGCMKNSRTFQLEAVSVHGIDRYIAP